MALLAGATALLLSACLGVTTAQSATTRSCATVPTKDVLLYNIRASGVRCATAQRVAKQWHTNLGRGKCTTSSCRARTFACRGVGTFPKTAVTCRRSGARVTWRMKLPANCGATRSCGTSAEIPDGLRV